MFGRDEDIAFLDAAWANRDVNVVTIVAWAGVGAAPNPPGPQEGSRAHIRSASGPALMDQLRYSIDADKVAAAMPLAKRLCSLAQEENDSTLMIGACPAVGGTYHYLGDFETARQYYTRALQIWRSGGIRTPFQEVEAQRVLVCPSRPYSGGISERSPGATPPWRKPSPWRRS